MSDLSGWVLLDKPEGISSFSALNRVKKSLKIRKAGHAGTLDPAASGLLLIALGEATKLLCMLDFATKTYHFDLHWGIATSTEDAEGEVIAHSDIFPEQDAIHQGTQHFIGSYPQSPPAFSALKVNGQRAYKQARAGKIDRLQARDVKVHDFKLFNHNHNSHISQLTVSFGKGGYVRAIGRDLAEHLNSVGHVQHIRRQSIGHLAIDNAISLAYFNEINDSTSQDKGRAVLPLESVLDGIPALDLTEAALKRLSLGQRCTLDSEYCLNISALPSKPDDALIYLMRIQGHVFGLGRLVEGCIKPKRLIHNHAVTKPISGA